MQTPNSNLSQMCSFEENASAFIIHFLMFFLLWWKNDVILKGKASSADDSLLSEVPLSVPKKKCDENILVFPPNPLILNPKKFSFSFLVATTQLFHCSHWH